MCAVQSRIFARCNGKNEAVCEKAEWEVALSISHSRYCLISSHICSFSLNRPRLVNGRLPLRAKQRTRQAGQQKKRLFLQTKKQSVDLEIQQKSLPGALRRETPISQLKSS